jgi:hypothetical protein
MTNLGQIIRDEIQTTPSIRQDLQKEIINIRALAKNIKKKRSLSYSLDAIISAIRRYEETDDFIKQFDDPAKLVTGSTLSSKNQICSILLEKNEEVLRTIPRIFERVEMMQHRILRFVHTQKSVKIFVDQNLLEQVTSLFPKNSVKTIQKDLGEIVIDLNEKSWGKPGILSLFASELYLNGINIQECLTCIPEIIFMVKEDKLMKAYEVLYKISKGSTD